MGKLQWKTLEGVLPHFFLEIFEFEPIEKHGFLGLKNYEFLRNH